MARAWLVTGAVAAGLLLFLAIGNRGCQQAYVYLKPPAPVNEIDNPGMCL
jgi:hypothetical protein